MSAALESLAPDMPVGVFSLLAVRLAVYRVAPNLPTSHSWLAPCGCGAHVEICLVWPCECGVARCPDTQRHWVRGSLVGWAMVLDAQALLGELDAKGLRLASAASWEGNA